MRTPADTGAVAVAADVTFLNWWFAPWAYARSAVADALPQDTLALRDCYRWWCAQAACAPDLPVSGEPIWHQLSQWSGQQLQAAAALYAGLLAAREHDMVVMASLPPADRKWCAAVASTQPLAPCMRAPYDRTDGAVIRGLAELACFLNHVFPGLWPRLRWSLSGEVAGQIDRLCATPTALAQPVLPLEDRRVARCWLMCGARAAFVPGELSHE